MNLLEKQIISYGDNFSNLESLLKKINDDFKKHQNQDTSLVHSLSYYDLANGLLGSCIFLSEMDFFYKDREYDKYAYNILNLGINRKNILALKDVGLWTGLSGVCFALRGLSKEGVRYNNLIQECEKILKPLIKLKLNEAKINLNCNKVKMTDYDLMEGLSGVATYILSFKSEDIEMDQLLNEILEYLCELTKYHFIDETMLVPNWHINSENQFIDAEKISFNKGNFNNGISHGITSVLVVLVKGLKVHPIPKIKNSIRQLIEWFKLTVINKDEMLVWEKKLSLQSYLKIDSEKNYSEDDVNFSWCYGDLMIARAIWFTGEALEDKELQTFALECFKTYSSRVSNINLISPTFCHGIAGTLAIVHQMWLDSSHNMFKDMEEELLKKILAFYNSKCSIFGYRDIEKVGNDVYKFNKLGFLSGNTGIYLVLLYILKNHNKTNWTQLVLFN